MDKAQIIEKLELGDYEIEYNEECHCNIEWRIVGDNHLDADIDPDTCWAGNALYVDGELIAEYIQYDGWITHALDVDDIPDEVQDEMRIGDNYERGAIDNQAHYDNLREALIDFLLEGNYILDRDDERAFANEYTSILRVPADGRIIDVTREEAEDWADDFLYAGDAATEAFNGFALEEAENDD